MVSNNNYTQDLQKLLIRGLITEPELFVRSQNILNPEYFDQQLQGTIRFVLEYANEYNTTPSPEQIQAETGIAIEKLEDFTQQHQQYYLNEIEGFCKHKALVSAILKSADLLEKDDPGGIERLVKDALLVSLQKEIGTDYFDDPLARLMALKDQNGTISTGWKTVDKKLYNVGRGELLIFAAPSGGGKSVALQNLTLNIALQGLNVVYITLELSEELCAKRLDSMLTGVPAADIYKKLEEIELKVKSAKKRCADITIKYMSPSSTRTMDLRTYLKEYEIEKGFSPDAIIVDYLDLLMPNDKRIDPSNLFIKDKFVAEELRALGKELGMLVATASQFNRTAEDVIDFGHAHIAGGKSKIDTADNLIGIHSGPTYRDRGEIRFQYLKTRNSGGVGQFTNLAYDLETLRITDLDESQYQDKDYTSVNVMDSIKNRTNTASKPQAAKSSSTTQDEVKSQSQNIRDLINKTRKT